MSCGESPDAPSRSDPVVSGFSELIGGPWGARAHRPARWFWIPARIVLLAAVLVLAFGWVQKLPCRNPGAWVNQHQYTQMCYSDVMALYYQEGLDSGKLPYADHAVEYPVLTGGMMAAASVLARAFPPDQRPERFFDITALLLGACGVVVVWTTLRIVGKRRTWDAAMVALAPVLLVDAFINWDLLAAAFTGLGLLAWRRRRAWLAGVALGLGVAAKLYPLLILVVVLPALASWGGGWRRFGWRDPGWRAVFRALGGAAVAWLVVDLPIWIAYPASFGRFYTDNLHRTADWDSLVYVVQYVTGRSGSPYAGPGFTVATSLAVVCVVGAVFVLALRAPVRPRIGQVAFLVVLAFLISNKVWSPQYALWLLPLAVLARPRWGPFLAWQAAEVWLLFTRYYFFVGLDVSQQGAPEWVFLLGVLIRDLTLLAFAALVIRDMYRPQLDVLRLWTDAPSPAVAGVA